MSGSRAVGTARSADGGHRPAGLDVAQQLLGPVRAPAPGADQVARKVAHAREPVAGLVVGGQVLAEQQRVGGLADRAPARSGCSATGPPSALIVCISRPYACARSEFMPSREGSGPRRAIVHGGLLRLAATFL